MSDGKLTSSKTRGKNTKSKKKSNGTRKRRYRKRNYISSSLSIFDRLSHPVTLTYAETISLSSSNLQGYAGSQYTWAINSLYDPNQTGGGHQPYGYDQMCLFFGRYCVYGAKFEFVVTEPSQAGLIFLTEAQSSNSSSSLTSMYIDQIREQQRCRSLYLDPTSKTMGRTLNTYWVSKVEKVKKSKVMSDDQYSSHNNTNPTLVPMVHVALCNDKDTTVATVVVHVKIQYYCKFSEPTILAQS